MKKIFGIIMSFIIVASLTFMGVGCAGDAVPAGEAVEEVVEEIVEEVETAEAEPTSGKLHVLTKEDIVEVYNPTAGASYQDPTMASPVVSGSSADLELTEAEKEIIRGMNLKIGFEGDQVDDAQRLTEQALRDQCKDLGINLSDIWMASRPDGISQMDDYQNFLGIADQYDAFFTGLTDASISSDILKEIMKTTDVGFTLAVPYDLDWSHENFVGVTDINAYEAGVSSAKVAIKILNGQGTLGIMGYIAGREGAINTCYQRYLGWDEVFADNPDVPVVQTWYEDPADVKGVVSSFMVANPDIKTLLIDWSYPPADSAIQACKELGLVPGEDIYIVSIDYDNVVTIPMASLGNESYVAACIAQDWYIIGENLIKMYAKHILEEGKNVKFVASNPAPVTTPMNVKTIFRIVVPETVTEIPMPPEIEALTDQWSLEDLGIENIWQ